MNANLDKDFYANLKCSQCRRYLYLPLHQCKTGHSICDDCKKRRSQCTVCYADFTTTQNVPLENILKKVMRTCEVCSESMPMIDTKHFTSCTLTVKCKIPGCRWKDTHTLLVDHIKLKHKALIFDNDGCLNSKQPIYVLNCRGTYFWLKRNVADQQLFWSLQHVKYEKCRVKYNITIKIVSNNDKCELVQTAQLYDASDADLMKAAPSIYKDRFGSDATYTFTII